MKFRRFLEASADERRRLYQQRKAQQPTPPVVPPTTRDTYYLLVVQAYSAEHGEHAFGGEEDVPANDSKQSVEWRQFVKDNASIALLQGKPMYVLDNSFGSYHEDTTNINAYVKIDHLTYLMIKQANPQITFPKETGSFEYADKGQNPRAIVTNFQGVEQTKQIMVQMMYRHEMPKPNAGESSEQMWQRLINVEKDRNRVYGGD